MVIETKKEDKKKVLIVEDEIALRNVIVDKLKSEEFDVFEAENGIEGLRIAFKYKPNIILLDIIMPKMNGIEMLRLLRKDPWGKIVPILLLTNDSNPTTMIEMLKNNASDYLIKSDWNLDSVMKMVRAKLI